jgi:hypothetical protein
MRIRQRSLSAFDIPRTILHSFGTVIVSISMVGLLANSCSFCPKQRDENCWYGHYKLSELRTNAAFAISVILKRQIWATDIQRA